jgi:hypothetical protein
MKKKIKRKIKIRMTKITVLQYRIALLKRYDQKGLLKVFKSMNQWIQKFTKTKLKYQKKNGGKKNGGIQIQDVLHAENVLVQLLVTKFPQYRNKVKLPTVPYVIVNLLNSKKRKSKSKSKSKPKSKSKSYKKTTRKH